MEGRVIRITSIEAAPLLGESPEGRLVGRDRTGGQSFMR